MLIFCVCVCLLINQKFYVCVLIFQDSLQGYKFQNKFLNKEILELTVLRRNSESREKALEAKVICVWRLTVHFLFIKTGSLSNVQGEVQH